MKKLFLIIILISGFSINLTGQSSIATYSPEFYFRNGLEMIEKANFTAARSSFQNFKQLAPNDARIPEADYFIAFSALNLYNLDGEQLFVDFLSNYSTHPKAISAYYELGSFFYQDKNYKKASLYLSKINFQIVSPEEQVEARFKLAYSLFSQRKFSESISHFNILKRGRSKYSNASAYYAAYIEYYDDDFDLALTDLQKAEESESYKKLVPYFVANIYYKQERYEELAEYGEKVLSENRTLTSIRDIYLLTAEGHYQLNNYPNALQFYELYLDGLSKNPLPEISFRIAVSYFFVDNNEKAISNFKTIASRKDAHGAAASYYLGWLYLRENNIEFAAAAFKIASETKDNTEIAEKAAFQYSKSSVDLGRSAEAVRQLISFKEKYPQSEFMSSVDELLSEAYLNSNNLDLAISHMESLGQMTTQTRKAYQKATLMKGNQFYNQRKYRDAVEMYEKSLKFPSNPELITEAKFWMSESYSVGRKYEEAIPGYLDVIGSRTSEMSIKARYGLGYSYFNTKDYGRALTQFRQYTREFQGSKKNRIYQDAVLRLADCYFVTKSNQQALTLYNESIKAGYTEKGYTYLQIGLVNSSIGNIDEGKSNFRKVIRDFSESPYVDDALFEYASLDYENGNYQSAIGSFSELIENKSTSPFVPYALQRRAISHFNLQTYGRTEQDYLTFLKQYPRHKEANNVLLGLQEVLTLQNKTEQFEGYFVAYKEANPDSEGLEVIEYETSRNFYNNQNYDKAIESFTAFMEAYPADYKKHEAKFYIAESYYRKQEYFNALPLYYEVLAENQVTQIIRVIQRIADLEYIERNYTKSISYYKRLESNALNTKDLFNSWIGQMKVFYQVSRYDSVTAYADKILEEGPLNAGIQNIATLYKGKDAYVRGNYEGALNFFQQTIDNAKDISGAEAQYLIGEVMHQQTKYRESNEVLFTMPANFSVYEEWLGKAFLLIADNYIQLEELLQARATLNSIIENTSSGVIANLAKAKLTGLDELEAETLAVPEDTVATDTIRIDNSGNNNNE
jgi:TolA-binding protein